MDNLLTQLSCLASFQSAMSIIFFTITLPEVRAGKYHRYKKDTIICTTWLSKAAIACGYQTLRILHQAKPEPKKRKNQASAGRLKGEVWHEAKAATEASKRSPTDTEPIPPMTNPEVIAQELLRHADASAGSEKTRNGNPTKVSSTLFNVPSTPEDAVPPGVRRPVFAMRMALRHLINISLESWKKTSSARHPSGPAEPSPPRLRDAPSTSEEPSQDLASRFSALDVEDLDESLNVAASVSPSTLSGEPRKRLSAWNRRCTRNSPLTTLYSPQLDWGLVRERHSTHL